LNDRAGVTALCAMVGGIVARRIGYRGLPDWLACREQLPKQDLSPTSVA
jgi:hypothetical protein